MYIFLFEKATVEVAAMQKALLYHKNIKKVLFLIDCLEIGIIDQSVEPSKPSNKHIQHIHIYVGWKNAVTCQMNLCKSVKVVKKAAAVAGLSVNLATSETKKCYNHV